MEQEQMDLLCFFYIVYFIIVNLYNIFFIVYIDIYNCIMYFHMKVDGKYASVTIYK